ncbi:MAG: winged helix-turn-helix domain-containing protein [Pseudomonadota bacterium]
MSQMDNEKQARKDALKNLREERKQWVAEASARMKAQRKDIRAIKQELKKDAGTVPMIAQATGIPSDRVLWYIATLKKYGEVVEGEKDGGYFQYLLADSPEFPNEEKTL